VKYIKEYNQEYYYSEITSEEYMTLYNGNRDKITDLEFRTIYASIKSFLKKSYTEEDVYIDSHREEQEIVILPKYGSDKITISKFEDEWWGISVENQTPYLRIFYKCDQIDGVLQSAPQLTMVLINGLFAPPINF